MHEIRRKPSEPPARGSIAVENLQPGVRSPGCCSRPAFSNATVTSRQYPLHRCSARRACRDNQKKNHRPHPRPLSTRRVDSIPQVNAPFLSWSPMYSQRHRCLTVISRCSLFNCTYMSDEALGRLARKLQLCERGEFYIPSTLHSPKSTKTMLPSDVHIRSFVVTMDHLTVCYFAT